MIWSILIPTITERKDKFSALVGFLNEQINTHGLQDAIEICSIEDSINDPKKMSIGEKRNRLVGMAQGLYVSYIDDDDWVDYMYIKTIYDALLKTPDVVGIMGIITFNGKQKTARHFIHSRQYKSYFEKSNKYYRPPNHLNPMLKTIAEMVSFKDKSHSEDTDWAMELCKLQPYKSEIFINKPLYFYKYVNKPLWK